MSQVIAKDVAAEIIIGPLVAYNDGVTPVTSPTLGNITAAVIKGGGGSSSPARSTITLTGSSGANDFVHLGDGYFRLELSDSETDTVGTLRVTLRDDDVFLPVFEDVLIYQPLNG